MNVEIVKKNNPAFLQWSCIHARRNHEKKVFDCYKDKMIQLWPHFFSKFSFFTIKMSIDEIQVVIKSACYLMLLILLYRSTQK